MIGRTKLGNEVYEGKFDLTTEPVALKFIPKKVTGYGAMKDRLDTELACLTKLKHTNILHANIQNLLDVVEKPLHMVRIVDYSNSLTCGNIMQYFLQEKVGFALAWEQAEVVILKYTHTYTLSY